MTAERHRRRWTPEEDQELMWSWGQIGASALARRLKRSNAAVIWRGYAVLGLGSVARGTWSIGQIAARAGYDQSVVKRALVALGMGLTRCRPMSQVESKPGHSTRAKPFRYAIDEDDALRVLEWLREHD